MSISSALSNAVSGLTSASRSAEIVSTNIANATNEGYAARSLSMGARLLGGVATLGVTRAVDPALLADRRFADAEKGLSGDMLAAIEKTANLLGTPRDMDSLVAHVTAFESSLIEAASQPDSLPRLKRAVESADLLAEKMRIVSSGVQASRTIADRRISEQIAQLNSDLEQTRILNIKIVGGQAQGVDVASLQDARQSLIDRISTIVPVREVPRSSGAVALFTPGGATLLDITAAKIGFTKSNLVTADMSHPAGTLSGLTINGHPLATDPQLAHLRGGTLDAAFQIRDSFGVETQNKLDILALDIIERFTAAGLDSTLPPGAPGLFTDGGFAYDPTRLAGLAGRISLNFLVDPNDGGSVFLLRDGLGATLPGPPSDASLLQRLSDTIVARRVPSVPTSDFGAGTLPDLAALITSDIATSHQFAEQKQSFATMQAYSLRQAELKKGVDTDDQLQQMLQIEKAYAANSMVVRTIGEMLDSLMRI